MGLDPLVINEAGRKKRRWGGKRKTEEDRRMKGGGERERKGMEKEKGKGALVM